MRTKALNPFLTIRSEGGLLPADFLQRLRNGDTDIQGLAPSDYHLPGNLKVSEAASRSWNVLRGAWEAFKTAADKLPAGDSGTSLTREKWLLPLFQELGYGRLQTTKAIEIEDKTYPVSHAWTHTPIHLIGFNADLDKRTPGIAGASKVSPHGMVQELLNRTNTHLWAFVSNGFRLRILRDNLTLTRQAFVEFDLASMMDGETYSDFVVLWLLCHQSRVEADQPHLCWLEKWTQTAGQQGTRALEKLRGGVEDAIESLGTGFLAHPANRELKDKLRSGHLNKQDYYRQILRTVYRIIFLFVSEDRELLFRPDADTTARKRYMDFHSTRRLRSLAEKRAGTKHSDLWLMLQLVFRSLGHPDGCPALSLTALGSFLWSSRATPDLDSCQLANHSLLDVIRHLSVTEEKGVRRVVDYRNLGSEELGSVYESLLEMHPAVHIETARFDLNVAAGNERKTSGSYFSPTSLVNCLLDSALEPVITELIKTAKSPAEAEKALLNLKVCDRACGSGHFLIAAAHRIAKRLAAVRSGESEPSPAEYQRALRDVIGHCIYGVDINPMAVELCKISLWLEAMEPGKPLGFLDHRIKVGNSLLGATPALLQRGIPDEAFNPIEGDDKKVCAEFKRQNKIERTGQMDLFDQEHKPWQQIGELANAILKLDDESDGTVAGVLKKQQQYEDLMKSGEYLSARFLADAWCAAFVMRKNKDIDYPITEALFRRIERNPKDCPAWMREEIQNLARQYQFFHPHIEFPDVFQPLENIPPEDSNGWKGGYNVILANPPWERVKLQEKEWFAERVPEIANAPNAAARKRLIANLEQEAPALYRAFLDAMRQAEGESHFLRNSSRYPLCGRGDINLYAVFAEDMRSVLSDTGRMGVILPSGIATDDTTKFFFQDVVENNSLRSLFDFENRKALFPAVDSRMKFCLFTSGSTNLHANSNLPPAEFAFFCLDVEDLLDPDKRFALSPEDIALLNPNTRTCPIFRSRRDAELTKAIYHRVSTLVSDKGLDANTWHVDLIRMLDMSNDSHLFESNQQPGLAKLYEAKMFHQYDHRWATYVLDKSIDLDITQKNDPKSSSSPRYWISSTEVNSRLSSWPHAWLLTYRDIARATDERTAIAAVIPLSATACHLCLPKVDGAAKAAPLIANWSSFVFDFSVRQKVGGTHLNFFYVKQLPVLGPESYFKAEEMIRLLSKDAWMMARVLELTYNAWDLEPFAQDCGYHGPPFRWDESRRFLIRCELDAAFFHLYLTADAQGDWKPASKADGCPYDETSEQLAELKKHFPKPRDAAAYIMDTFPIVKRKDEEKYGNYRTKDTILEIYDAMAEAASTGKSYYTKLNPEPMSITATHLPQMPSTNRPVYSNADEYLMQFILSYVSRVPAGIDAVMLGRAVALLATRQVFLGHLRAEVGDVLAKSWADTFMERFDPGLCKPVLKDLIHSQMIGVQKVRDDIRLRIQTKEPIYHPEWVELDVTLVQRVQAALAATKIDDLPEVISDIEAVGLLEVA